MTTSNYDYRSSVTAMLQNLDLNKDGRTCVYAYFIIFLWICVAGPLSVYIHEGLDGGGGLVFTIH